MIIIMYVFTLSNRRTQLLLTLSQTYGRTFIVYPLSRWIASGNRSIHQERLRQSSAQLSISLLYIDIRYILLFVCLPVEVIFRGDLRQVEIRNGRMCYTIISVMVKLNECVKFGFLVHNSISHQISYSRSNIFNSIILSIYA